MAWKIRTNPAVQTIWTFVVKFANDWSFNLVGMVSYSLITAIFPILLVILSIAAIILQPFVSAHLDTVAAAISSAFPEAIRAGINVSALLKSLIQITGPVAIFSLIALVWLGSNLFVTIENAFSVVYRIRGRDIIPQRLVAVAMVLILTVLLPVSLVTASLITTRSTDFASFLPAQARQLLSFVGPLTSLGVLWLLFLTIYVVVPNRRVPFQYAWRGAITAAVLFFILQLAFPLYFTIFLHGNMKYGALAATILVVIIWLWFFALILIVGAQINALAMGLKPMQADVARIIEDAYASFARESERLAGRAPGPRGEPRETRPERRLRNPTRSRRRDVRRRK